MQGNLLWQQAGIVGGLFLERECHFSTCGNLRVLDHRVQGLPLKAISLDHRLLLK